MFNLIFYVQYLKTHFFHKLLHSNISVTYYALQNTWSLPGSMLGLKVKKVWILNIEDKQQRTVTTD